MRRAERAAARAHQARRRLARQLDGIVGRQTWGAIFDLYVDHLEEAIASAAIPLAERRAALSFVNSQKKVIGCGEHKPLTANPIIEQDAAIGRLARDGRRVELIFFEPGQEPSLRCHPQEGECLPTACDIYNGRCYRLRALAVDPAGRTMTISYLLQSPDQVEASLAHLPDSAAELLLGQVTDEEGPLGVMDLDAVFRLSDSLPRARRAG